MMAVNIHETVMALIGGRTIPLTFIVIAMFVLGGVVLDEELTFKIIDQADTPIESAYAVFLIAKDVVVVSVLVIAMGAAFWSLNLKSFRDVTGQPKGNENEDDHEKTG